MSSIKQYIDLFEANRKDIDAHSPAVLNALRNEAFKSVDGKNMPTKGNENFEVTDLEAMFAPDYGVNVNRLEFGADPMDAFRCDVPNMSTWLYYSFNDIYHRSRTATISLPDGVLVGSLHDLAESHPQLVEKYYGKVAPISNMQVALNTMFAQDGLLVYIPANKILEKPLQLVNILNATVPVMSNRRILVVIGENSQARMLVCDHTQNKAQKYLCNQVIEVVAEPNSVLDFYDLEESSSDTNRVSSMWVRQEQGSNVLINGITLMNGMTRNDYNVEVVGEHSETHLYGMAIAGDHQHVDNHTFIGHRVGNCKSNELFKYILEDNARGVFAGKILVAPDSPRIEAYQGNRNICLSPTAKMYTKPQLEIYTDDVKCSHGATIGQLDQEALFYMQTRGISAKEARMLLMQAFMSDVLDTVRLDALKDRLRHLVDKRLYGKLALCQECGNECHEVINKVDI